MYSQHVVVGDNGTIGPVNTEAHEYATALQNNNGDMNALIAFMRKRAGQRSMYSPLAGAGVILCVRVRRSRISQVMVR